MPGLWPWIEILPSRGHESQGSTQLVAAIFHYLFIETVSSSARVATVSWSPRLMSPVSSLGCFLHRGLHFNPTGDCVVADGFKYRSSARKLLPGCQMNPAG